MLRASFAEEIGGRRVTLAMPLSAIRKVAVIEPIPVLLARRLVMQQATLAEVEAVLDAATGDPDITRHVVESVGLTDAILLAARIMVLALTRDIADEPDEAESGNAPAAA